MKIEIEYSKNKSLLSALGFLILGSILLSNAEAVLTFVSVGLGTVLLFSGIYKIITTWKASKTNPIAKFALFTGILYFTIGIIFIFFADIVETSIRFFFGAWILFSAVNQLINAFSISIKNTRFISSLIISVLLIALGLYVIFTENLILSSIGIVMIIYSVIEIVGFIFWKKKVKTIEPKEGETTLIIPDKDKK